MAVTPPTIIDHPSKHRVSRNGEAIVAIVLHGTAGSNSLGYLTENALQVSTHYLLPRDGLHLFRMVSEADGANHAGAISSTFSLNGRTYKAGGVNRATIGIELESLQTGRDDYTEPQLLAMGWLINDIRTRRGNLPILRHAELDPTRRRDPVNLTHDQIEKWANAAILVYGPAEPPAPLLKRYRVKHRYITQRQEDNGPPIVRELIPGEELVVDKMYTNNRVHIADGSGFADLADLEAI